MNNLTSADERDKPGPWNHFCLIHRLVWSAYGRHGYLAGCWHCAMAGRWTNQECDGED